MKKRATTGNHGEKIRSDCRISLELKDSGGLNITIESKVRSLYEHSIRSLMEEILQFYKIGNANVLLEDSGALPFALAARMETAIRKVSNTKREFLLSMDKDEPHLPDPDRFRISRLYLPGNNPSMMINAGIHQPDGVILDLEDSVLPEKKDEARILVRNALRALDFYGAEQMVRINQLPLGLEDASVVVPHQVDLLLIPKCEHDWQVKQVNEVVDSTLKGHGLERKVFLMPIIESALGVENAYKIATVSGNVVAMAIGLEDFSADIGVSRTEEGNESLYARMRVVNACKAAGIQPIDSVYSDVSNDEGLRKNVCQSKSLGFEGMGCIHPSQIRIIHEEFQPGEKEIGRARKIVEAFEAAKKEGTGVVSIGSKMIDAPVVKRAEQTLLLAKRFGK
ncbi:MAG: HpcH/HpaI aldolase/citrate lyase family protein [Bacteroidales bacterium]|nr:HpcH/HpaI aldolase/citrate lyase family protein [Bacteroidales bacterium]